LTDKYVKKERKRLINLADRAYNNDPRIKVELAKEAAAKEEKKQAKKEAKANYKKEMEEKFRIQEEAK